MGNKENTEQVLSLSHSKLRADPDWYRIPVMFSVTNGNDTCNVATLHAPGPESITGEILENLYLRPIADHKSKSEADVVIGDFNLRNVDHDMLAKYNFCEILPLNGQLGTTFGQGITRWDRVFANMKHVPKRLLSLGSVDFKLKIVKPQHTLVSDHYALQLEILT